MTQDCWRLSAWKRNVKNELPLTSHVDMDPTFCWCFCVYSAAVKMKVAEFCNPSVTDRWMKTRPPPNRLFCLTSTLEHWSETFAFYQVHLLSPESRETEICNVDWICSRCTTGLVGISFLSYLICSMPPKVTTPSLSFLNRQTINWCFWYCVF